MTNHYFKTAIRVYHVRAHASTEEPSLPQLCIQIENPEKRQRERCRTKSRH